ncbi:MAG: hypothetical protein IKZ17_06920 [Bacteroidaceae bacterium]|nr:hypothetical protein [Bacteroidaceae bacterium]
MAWEENFPRHAKKMMARWWKSGGKLIITDKNYKEGLSSHPNKVVSSSQYHKGTMYSGTGVPSLWYWSVIGLTLQYQRDGIVAAKSIVEKGNAVQ